MATVTATANYPDNLQAELRDVLAFEWGYEELIDGQPNPQTKAQFIQENINKYLRAFLKNTYRNGKQRQQAISDIDFN